MIILEYLFSTGVLKSRHISLISLSKQIPIHTALVASKG